MTPRSPISAGPANRPSLPDPEWLSDLVSKVRMIARHARGTTSLGGELRSFTTILTVAANMLERGLAHASPLGGPSLALEAKDPLPTLPVEREAVARVIKELIAKSWQSVRIGRGMKRREEHVTFRAAMMLEGLLAALQASEARIAEVELAHIEEANSLRDRAIERTVAAKTAEARLAKVVEALKKLIVYYENGDHHDEGAFHPDCPDCAALAEARQALSELEGK